MSNAAHGAASQTSRAGIREGAGTGGGAAAAPAAAQNPMIPLLVPKADDVIKLLQGKSIIKKPEKHAAVKGIFDVKPTIAVHLESVETGSSERFEGIEMLQLNTSQLKKASAESLGKAIYDIATTCRSILPRSSNFEHLAANIRPASRC